LINKWKTLENSVTGSSGYDYTCMGIYEIKLFFNLLNVAVNWVSLLALAFININFIETFQKNGISCQNVYVCVLDSTFKSLCSLYFQVSWKLYMWNLNKWTPRRTSVPTVAKFLATRLTTRDTWKYTLVVKYSDVTFAEKSSHEKTISRRIKLFI